MVTARTIVVTGASDGIGAAAARQLHQAGHAVVLVGRDAAKTRTVAAELDAPFHLADFAELDQVRALADALHAAHPRIDVLANNAGGIMGSRRLTVDGHEQTFQVNHLAPFLLTNLLLDTLRASRATLVQTASIAARRFARFDIADLDGEHAWDAATAYGNAKLANILFTAELDRRYAPELSAVAFHPGVVATGFAAGSGGMWEFVYQNPLARRLLTSTEKGGSRLTWLVQGEPGREWERGAYYERNRRAATNPLAADVDLARELWERSAEHVGL